jgi:alpha-beta hydrolase superfamily lysophospholipase
MLHAVILILSGLVIAGISMLVVSFVGEAVRPKPVIPKQLRWAPNIRIQYVSVDGARLRYIKVGEGPALVLLHTLRTQLDLFEKVVPELSKRFTVYALDYPGHGYSDIPAAKYDAAFFADAVEGFLEALELRGVTLAGVSIGASISLILALAITPVSLAWWRSIHMTTRKAVGWRAALSSQVSSWDWPIYRQLVRR